MSEHHRKKRIVADKSHMSRKALIHPVDEVGEAEQWDQELWEEGPLEAVIEENGPWVDVSIAIARLHEAGISFGRPLSSGDAGPSEVGIRSERTFDLKDELAPVVGLRPDRTFDLGDDE